MQIMSDGLVTPCRSYIDYPWATPKRLPDGTLDSPAYVDFGAV
jgi:hypothetical protein